MRSVLFTWNGDWGLFTDTGLQRGVSWRQVVEHLQQAPRLQALWEELTSFCTRLADLLGARSFAFSLELCVETWMEDSLVRVHGHAYFTSEGGKMRLARAAHASFKNSAPFKSHKLAALSHRNCSGWSGCYYIMAPKVGSIKTFSSVRPYKDFAVSPEWITGMVQAEKMEFEDELVEMTKCGKGYQRRVADLKAWRQGKMELELQAHVDAEQAFHAASNLAFHRYPQSPG